MKLTEFVQFLDEYFKIDDWQDVSVNGLQVEGKNEVEKVAFAVDACLESFKRAKEVNADVLVVHHGIVWGSISRIRGLIARRIGYLLKNEISLYAVHLPLDAHETVGNNVSLIKIAGFKPEGMFGEYKGKKIGFFGSSQSEINVYDVAEKLKNCLKCDVKILDFGGKIKKAGAISGKGSFAVEEAHSEGMDLLITGEAEHSAYHIAKELEINVIFAGHYATETLGLKAFMSVVKELGLETEFIDIPTGL